MTMYDIKITSADYGNHRCTSGGQVTQVAISLLLFISDRWHSHRQVSVVSIAIYYGFLETLCSC